MRHRRDEKGAALLEMAIVTGLLLLLAIGSVELGFAFKQWVGLSSSARAGARTAASVGDGHGDAAAAAVVDCAILESVAATLSSTTGAEVLSVRIEKFDIATNSSAGPFQQYRPFVPSTDNPANLACASWYRLNNSWPATNRVASGHNPDWLRVVVNFRHSWVTGLFMWAGETDWSSSTTMRLEPAS